MCAGYLLGERLFVGHIGAKWATAEGRIERTSGSRMKTKRITCRHFKSKWQTGLEWFRYQFAVLKMVVVVENGNDCLPP